MKKKRFIAAVMAGILMVGSICSQTAQAAASQADRPQASRADVMARASVSARNLFFIG